MDMQSCRLSRVLLALALLIGSHCADAQERDEVPDWFRFDAEQPYAIFDAWKHLSTRAASICLGENWQVLAGRLQNARGEPLENTPIAIVEAGGIRVLSAQLQTDASGHFIVYAPYSLQLTTKDAEAERRPQLGRFVSAASGFPPTPAGRAFAAERQAFQRCQRKLLSQDGQRAFYVLTCEDGPAFDAGAFRAFEAEYLQRKREPQVVWRDQPRDPEGQRGDRVIRYYDLHLVDSAGNGVANALVKYQFSGIVPGCYQVRRTDNEGRCRIEEWLLPRQAAGDERPDDYIRRTLTVDAPGLGVGPVPFDLKAGQANLIRLSQPGVVAGRVVDHAGEPLPCRLKVHYRRHSHVFFETDIWVQTDGTYRFERIMPNEEFTVESEGFDRRWSQRPSVRSEWISLEPGELREGVRLQVPLASALRGVAMFTDGWPAEVGDRKHSLYLDYGPDTQKRQYVGTDNGPWGPRDSRFGFFGLDDRPFRIRVATPGWEVEPAEPLQLEPGELRFVRITLRKSGGK
jgi:hypothetical protein